MRVDRIVIGIDFSEPSLAAARWVARHFGPGIDVILVHAIEVPRPPSFVRGVAASDEESERTTREGAEHRLREFGASLGVDRVLTEVRVGRPSDLIAEVAEARRADTIAVGEHGHRGGLWDALGSTAEELVRTSTVPVLLARRLPETAPRTILVPVDESDVLTSALRWGRDLTEDFDACAIGFYAVDPRLLARIRRVSSEKVEHDLERDTLAEAARWLEARFERAGFAHGRVRPRVVIGHPGPEIITAAQRYEADLIVMASRSAGRSGDAMIGSTARAVLRGAPCPVLIVNQPDD